MRRPSLAHGLVTFGSLRHALLPLARNLSSVLGGPPLASSPFALTWALTERCGNRCQHCSLGRTTPEVDADSRQVLADRIARSGIWGSSLIGGEPTLVPDLASYVSVIKARGKYVSVGTSGYRLSHHLDALVAAEVDTLVLSLDHRRAEEHDHFRGRQGLFLEASSCIARLRALRGKRPRVQVRSTLHRNNIHEFPDIVDYWRARADHVVIQVIQDNAIHAVRDAEVLFRSEDRPVLEETVAELLRRDPGLRSPYFVHLVDYVFEPHALRERLGFRCMIVPGATVTLMPNGDLRLCYGHEESHVGNLLEDDLATLWRSPATSAIRRRMQSRELGCICWEQSISNNLDLLPWLERAQRWLP